MSTKSAAGQPTAVAAARAAAQDGAISGHVLGPADIPLSGICVTATGNGRPRSARTDGSGRYIIAGVPAGAYKLSYADCASPDTYPAQSYPAGTVHVTEGRAAQLAPVVMSPATPAKGLAFEQAYQRAHPATAVVGTGAAGTPKAAAAAAKNSAFISGIVRNKSGKPLAGVCVTGTGTGRIKIDKSVYTVSFQFYVSTATNGRYSIGSLGLQSTSLKVLFTMGCGVTGNYAPQWWRDAASLGRATKLDQKSASTTFSGIDATLTKGASIAGVVHADSSNGPGLPGVCVIASGRGGQTYVSMSAKTGTNGRYVLHGLGTGTYAVRFAACSSGNFLGTKYGRVDVKVGKTRSASGYLLPGATISGTVTSSQGGSAGVSGICVLLTDSQGDWLNFGTTNASGHYNFTRLVRGTYYISLSGGCGNSGSYAPQFYDSTVSTGTLSFAVASPISVGYGQSATADTAMLPGGTVSGTVTAQGSGSPLKNVCALLLGDSTGEYQIGTATPETNSAGTYTAANLEPGLYLADFTECGSAPYADAWFAPEGGAEPQFVSVGADGVTTGVSVALSRAGTITGTVTNKARKGLGNICIQAESLSAPTLVALYQALNGTGISLSSANTGHYRIARLAPGKYSVEFAPCLGVNGRYAPQLYRDKRPGTRATAVTVRSARTAKGINAVLTAGRKASGRILSASTGKPLTACIIDAWPETPGLVLVIGGQGTFTNASGRFTLSDVSAGAYEVEVAPCSEAYAPVVTIVHVPAGHGTATLSAIRIARAGTLAGTASAPGVAGGAAYACVEAMPVTGEGLGGEAVVAADGSFSVPGLAPGQYEVEVDDSCSGSNVLAPELITTTISAGQTSNITASLTAFGSITGTVTSSAAPGQGIGGVCVGMYPSATATAATAVAITAADGTYQAGFLPAGSYVVKFSTGCGATGYATQWYDGATSAASATPVTVSAGAAEGGIDATLSS